MTVFLNYEQFILTFTGCVEGGLEQFEFFRFELLDDDLGSLSCAQDSLEPLKSKNTFYT